MAGPAAAGVLHRTRSLRLHRADSADNLKRHLARELHDQVVQDLVSVVVDLENFKREQFGRHSVIDRVASVQETTRHVLRNVREMLIDLRGETRLRTDLVGLLRTELLPRFEKQTGALTTLSVSGSWPAEVGGWAAFNLYRIVQESLANIRHHSAAAHVYISLLVTDEGQAVVTVGDDGVGIVPDEPEASGIGIIGMRERAGILGGSLSVRRLEVGGTEMRLSFSSDRLI